MMVSDPVVIPYESNAERLWIANRWSVPDALYWYVEDAIELQHQISEHYLYSDEPSVVDVDPSEVYS